MPSSSLIKVKESVTGDFIEVKDGIVDIIIAKNQIVNIKVNGKNHQIMANQHQSKIKVFNSAGELHIFTEDKDVKIKNDQGTYNLATNQDSILNNDKVVSDQEFLLYSPIPGENIGDAQEINIHSSIKSKFKVSISKNIDFSPPILEDNFENNTFRWKINLDEGSYFLKIENDKTRKIIPIRVESAYTVSGHSPGDNELVTLHPKDNVEFHWNSLPVKSYKVILRSNTGEEVVFITSTNHLTLNKLKFSKFEWTVLPELAGGKYSNIFKPIKSSVKIIGKIQFHSIPQKSNFLLNEEKLTFKWNAEKDEHFLIRVFNEKDNSISFENKTTDTSFILRLDSIGKYKVTVTSVDYPDFEKAEFNYSVSTPILTWALDLPKEIKSADDKNEITLKFNRNVSTEIKAQLNLTYSPLKHDSIKKSLDLFENKTIELNGFGQHCMSATPLTPTEYVLSSEKYCVNIIQVAAFTQLPKAKDAILALAKQNVLDGYRILVPSIDKAVKYLFEIYKDKQGEKLIYSTLSNTPDTVWNTNLSGIYYLRYKVYDNKNRESNFSAFSQFIFPISPDSDWRPED
jgi:hypothetical protein